MRFEQAKCTAHLLAGHEVRTVTMVTVLTVSPLIRDRS